eukprot:1160005-Pelagomonas_calceolata.AAC.9
MGFSREHLTRVSVPLCISAGPLYTCVHCFQLVHCAASEKLTTPVLPGTNSLCPNNICPQDWRSWWTTGWRWCWLLSPSLYLPLVPLPPTINHTSTSSSSRSSRSSRCSSSRSSRCCRSRSSSSSSSRCSSRCSRPEPGLCAPPSSSS